MGNDPWGQLEPLIFGAAGSAWPVTRTAPTCRPLEVARALHLSFFILFYLKPPKVSPHSDTRCR